MSSEVVHGVDIRSGQPADVRLRNTSESIVVCSKAGIALAVVVSETEHDLQVLDPQSMEPIELRKPTGFVRKSDKVRLAKTRKGIYPLSDSW